MRTILIVDDEYAIVESLAELLRDEGYRVVSAANGKDGLARVQAEKPDLVLTDSTTPIADGRELIRGVRALPEFRSTPIVLMSSSTKSAALSDPNGGTLDVSAFLQKPFTWEKVLEIVVRYIGTAEQG